MMKFFGMILDNPGVVLFTVFFFGFCIFIHEFGHFIAALWRGLHVEKFSIGFGHRIWGFKWKGVDFIVGWLPLGGYVAIPQLDPVSEPETSEGKKLPVAKPLDRMITAFAGPFFNILFAFFLSFFVWHFGLMRPQVDSFEVYKVPQDHAEYKAGLRSGDEIIAINGTEVKEFSKGWGEAVERIATTVGKVNLIVKSGDESKTIQYTPDENPDYENGAFPFFTIKHPVRIAQLTRAEENEMMPAEKAGVKVDDIVLSVNSEPVVNVSNFIKQIDGTKGNPFSMTLDRNGEIIKIQDIIAIEKTVPSGEEQRTAHFIGVQLSPKLHQVHPTPTKQLKETLQRIGRVFGALFAPLFGKESHVTINHLGGMPTIVTATGVTVINGGYVEGLFFIVFLSFNLAFINLLPIPVLDGGHITFSLVEMTIRRPLPTKLVHHLQTLFAVLLIGLMLYVNGRDLFRFGKFFSSADKEKAEEAQPASEDKPTQITEESASAETPVIP